MLYQQLEAEWEVVVSLLTNRSSVIQLEGEWLVWTLNQILTEIAKARILILMLQIMLDTFLVIKVEVDL